MRRSLRALSGLAVLGLSLAVALPATAGPKPAVGGKTIVIGSTNFPEQFIVANMYADVLRHAGFTVEVKANLGTRAAVEPALAHGQLDLYPDYAGSLLAFLNAKATGGNILATAVAEDKAALAKVGATVLDPAPAVDTNVFAVTQATAQKYKLTTLSSLKPVASKLVLGGPPECPTYAYCLPGLKRVYGLKFKSFVSLDEAGPVSVAALKSGRAQVVEFFSSDGNILTNNFVQLTDNKNLQPADHVIPVIRTAVDTPAVAKALNALSAELTTNDLAKLNLQVSVDKKDPATVAASWLKLQGLT